VENGADVHARDDEPLRIACERGNLELAKYLVKNGANVRAQNDYALRWARSKEMIDFLIENGADPSSLNPKPVPEPELEHFSSVEVMADVLKELTKKDALFGERILGVACKEGKTKLVEFLISQGVNTRFGDDILLVLAEGHKDIVRLLEQNRA
jgi:ankyrin repeat protein